MPYPLRFHVLLLSNVAWDELKTRVLRLEALGLEVAALGDHFVDWTNPTAPWLETWTALVARVHTKWELRARDATVRVPVPRPESTGARHRKGDLRAADE